MSSETENNLKNEIDNKKQEIQSIAQQARDQFEEIKKLKQQQEDEKLLIEKILLEKQKILEQLESYNNK
ncbi:hypothetical protein DDB_G0278007 [Dictyostelium discoideum AX4]|uniref:Uncharacterized protein n=1 Tax=Dictyostelium discoideum TaxID=44689 RepID=Q54YY5_DICDI|nr:hypothetical protein DDB_G0278007 [Dictyostelium discoideum AX4]EAL68176.1 hypothetical protein DDB_G0278007 [Dictyostelium discoideum AX4]|eukprot:XP_642067.1 hypothetical protein DDB_G0278007 [Dictyostelium discoideum AX4]